MRMQPTSSSGTASESDGKAPREPAQVLLRAGGGRDAAWQRPCGGLGRGAHVGLIRRRLAGQQRRQLAAPAAALVLELGLGLRVALDRVGGEFVDVGEDRLGEQAEHLRVEPRIPPGCGDPPPGDPRPDPVGGLQRVERAALPQLAAAEGDIDLTARLPARLRVADQGDELAQRLGDSGADPAPEAALERPRVLGDLAGDRREDLLGDPVELGLDQVRDLGGECAPGLRIAAFCHSGDKNME